MKVEQFWNEILRGKRDYSEEDMFPLGFIQQKDRLDCAGN